MDTQVAEMERAVTPDGAAHMILSSPAFRAQRIATEAEAQEVTVNCERMERPAPGKWISARVVTLLSHYFVAASEQRVVEAMAADWVETLRKYPAWAIQNACRWWLSAENEWHHRKPLPGDIEDRCKREMEPIKAARTMVRLARNEPEPEREAISPEDMQARREAADAILAELGFKSRVGGAETNSAHHQHPARD